mmetsp:Transcript_31157/g.50192  ORF Transcript_31157/g.50192 Transcript_31157/m.50192 type:complete len:266 (+) Transcript_31157:1313-2110(+)
MASSFGRSPTTEDSNCMETRLENNDPMRPENLASAELELSVAAPAAIEPPFARVDCIMFPRVLAEAATAESTSASSSSSSLSPLSLLCSDEGVFTRTVSNMLRALSCMSESSSPGREKSVIPSSSAVVVLRGSIGDDDDDEVDALTMFFIESRRLSRCWRASLALICFDPASEFKYDVTPANSEVTTCESPASILLFISCSFLPTFKFTGWLTDTLKSKDAAALRASTTTALIRVIVPLPFCAPPLLLALLLLPDSNADSDVPGS